ncbi:MAG: hypothetical protein PHC62_03890 [Candidatus Izemoplasmatales bacterium]|nr:hypothetical protein [Candidatus Izemoplasmatales bacterium]
MNEETLKSIKTSLRTITQNADILQDIGETVAACLIDLGLKGIVNGIVQEDEKIEDALILQAVKTYCKANFSKDSKDIERYQNSYEMMKQDMRLSSDYMEKKEDVA